MGLYRKVMFGIVFAGISVFSIGFADCPMPSQGSYWWSLVGYQISNLTNTSSGPVTGSGYTVSATRANNASTTLSGATLSTSKTETTKYSSSFKIYAGYQDKSTTVTIKVTTNIPPYMVAMLETEQRAQTKFYEMSVYCKWQDTKNGKTATTYHGKKTGDIYNTWYADKLSFRKF